MRRLISMMLFHIKMYFQSPLGVLAFIGPVVLSVFALWCVQQQGSITSMGRVGISITDGAIVSEELVAELEEMNIVVEEMAREDIRAGAEKGKIDVGIISETENRLKSLANNESVVTLVYDEGNTTSVQIKQIVERKLSRLSYLAYASNGDEKVFEKLIYEQKEGMLEVGLAEKTNMEQIIAFGMFVFMFLMNVGFSLSPMMREKEQGIVERIRLSSMRQSVYIGGHILGSLVLLILQMSLQGIGFMLFDQDQGINYLQFLGIGVTLCIVGISIACLLMSFTKNSSQFMMVINIGVIPLCVVSDCLVPLELLPTWVQNISIIFPLTWVIKAYKGMIAERGIDELIIYLGVAILISTTLVLLTIVVEKQKKVCI